MSPKLRFWLRVPANLMLAFGALVAFVNPPQVFGPGPVGLILLMAAATLLWLLTIRAWSRGPLMILDLAGLCGILVIELFAATRSQTTREHLTVMAALGQIPDLGLSGLTYYFNPRYGPKLVRSAHAMEPRCSYKLSGLSPIEGRGEYAFCYASYRLRGKSDDQILAVEKGPDIFLGTLAAESFEPYWWHSADWLKNDLPLHPAADWKMGLLPPDFARAAFQQLLSRTPLDPDLVEAMLFIALERPSFATQLQRDALLTTWSAARAKSGFPLGPALAVRQPLLEKLAAQAKDGHLSVHLELPDTWSPESREAVLQSVVAYLRSAGIDAQPSSDGYPLRITAAFRDWDNVTYSYREDVTTRIDEYHPGESIHVGNASYATLPWTSHRDVTRAVSKQQTGKLGLPTLLLEAGGQTFALPPTSLISREEAYSLAACDPRRARPGSERDVYESELTRMLLDPWRLALYWPNSLDDLFKRDSENIPR